MPLPNRSAAMEIAPRIVVDPSIQSGKPVIRGTRIPVDLIVGQIAGGMSAEQVGTEYDLEIEDVRAALAYAAQILSQETVRAV